MPSSWPWKRQVWYNVPKIIWIKNEPVTIHDWNKSLLYMSCLWSRYQFKYFKSAPAVTSSVFMRRFRLYFWDSVRVGDGRQALLWKQPTIQQFNKTIVLLVRNSLKISPLSKINLYFTTRENPFQKRQLPETIIQSGTWHLDNVFSFQDNF